MEQAGGHRPEVIRVLYAKQRGILAMLLPGTRLGSSQRQHVEALLTTCNEYVRTGSYDGGKAKIALAQLEGAVISWKHLDANAAPGGLV